MRVLLAMLKHETNTFSPVKTDLARFEAWGLKRDGAVLEAYRGTNMPIAAYIDLAEARKAEIVSPVAAEAMPSGVVEEEAYETLAEWILAPLRDERFDGIFLDLHGAMTTAHLPDGEGELLRRMRALAPDTPIAVTCDMHCNLTEAMVENCDALIGYKTYPHVDMYEVGAQVGRILWNKIEGKSDPVMAWGAAPLLAQTLRMGTADEPMKSLQAMTEAEVSERGLLATTLFGGFPLADVHHAGLSAVSIAEGDKAACCGRPGTSERIWSTTRFRSERRSPGRAP